MINAIMERKYNIKLTPRS